MSGSSDDRHYVPGDNFVISDRSGFKIRRRDSRKQWNGLIVHRDEYEARHPQDFVRSRRDSMTVPDPRPRPADIYAVPEGGPFFRVMTDEFGRACFEVEESAEFFVYRGTTVTASDL